MRSGLLPCQSLQLFDLSSFIRIFLFSAWTEHCQGDACCLVLYPISLLSQLPRLCYREGDVWRLVTFSCL